jgi:hypothetical protein
LHLHLYVRARHTLLPALPMAGYNFSPGQIRF